MREIWIPQHEADLFVSLHHRHHKPARGDIFRIAAVDDLGMIVGVVQIGRPVARGYNGKNMCEVTRLCTDGTRNACSFLYAAAVRKAPEVRVSEDYHLYPGHRAGNQPTGGGMEL